MAEILVVEDDASIRQTLQRVLERLCPQCTIRSVENAQDALADLRNPKIILSDHSMPGMSGLEFLATVREQLPAAHRVLLTAYPLSELDPELVSKADLHHFLAKPFQLAQIKSLIETLAP